MSGPSRRAFQRTSLLLALLAFTLCLQGARGLFEPDEGRYTAVAWQMTRTGDWFTPRLATDLPHFTKPPLTYWLLAGSVTLLGRSEWALRLPIALLAAATVLLVWWMARRLVPRAPELAALVQATSLLPFGAATLVSTDTPLVTCETLAVAGFVAAWWEPRMRRGVDLMWLGFGLAFLVKGPPGLLPLLPIVAFAVLDGGARAARRLLAPVGLLLFALVALPWFLLQMHARPDLYAYLLGDEVRGRLEGVQIRNPGWRGLAVAYLPTALLGPLPWSVVWLARRRGAAVAPAASAVDARARATRRFLLLWLLLPLLVFAAAQSRLPLYLLPLFVPFSLLVARGLAPVWRWSRGERTWVAVLAATLLLIKLLAATLPYPRDGRAFARGLRPLLGGVPPREIVFVDRTARYSQEIYFGCDVETVELMRDLLARSGPAYRPLVKPLRRALDARERGLVWVVRPESSPAWQSALAEAGWARQRLGTVDGDEIWRADPRSGP